MRDQTGQRRDQDLAEKIRGDDVELSGELLLEDVAGRNSMLRTRLARAFRLAMAQARGSLSIASTRAAPKQRPQWPECRCQSRRRASSSLRALARVTFEEAQAHRRRRMLAGAESGLGRNDECEGSQVLSARC